MSDRVTCRPGGRSARIQASVHEAVQALTQEIGRADLTVPLIAQRAGVTPSTLYRRWGDLTNLLADVSAQRLHPDQTPPDTGAWDADLRGWAEQYAEEMSSVPGRQMIRDQVASGENAAARCALYTSQQIGIMRERAVTRGEAPPDTDRVVELVVAPILFRILFDERPADRAFVTTLLDRL